MRKHSKVFKLFLTALIVFIGFRAMAQWELVTQEGGVVYEMAQKNNTVFTATTFGVYKSSDNGQTWTESNNGLTNTVAHSIIVWHDTLVVGTEDGVFVSGDMANTWTAANTGITGQKIYRLLPVDNGLFAASETGGVLYTTNLNSSWTPKNNGITNLYIKTLAKKGDYLFAGSWGDGVFVSNDNGNSWSVHNTGFSSWFINFIFVRGSKVFVSTESEFCLSTNNGNSWTILNMPFGDTRVLCGLNNNETMLLGTDGDGVFYSNDEGVNWTEWNEGLPNYNMYCFALVNNYYWVECCCGYGIQKRLASEITAITDHKTDLSNKINIFPNPANDNIIIDFNTNQRNTVLEIYDMTGNLVKKEQKISNYPFKVETDNFLAGTYLIKILNNNKMIARKAFIKK